MSTESELNESKSLADELYEKARERYGETFLEAIHRNAPWNAQVTYPDWEHLLTASEPPGRRVDVAGCSMGGFAEYLAHRAWDVTGWDPAEQVGEYPHVFPFHNEPYEDSPAEAQADVVICHDVIEHLHYGAAEALMAHAYTRLRPQGIFMLGCPNDDSPLQHAVSQMWGLGPYWWQKEHLSYWNAEKLLSCLRSLGFQEITRTTTFPMEVFALLGVLYPLARTLGRKCHEKRVALELAMKPWRRRWAYQILAEAGLGRHVILLLRKPA